MNGLTKLSLGSPFEDYGLNSGWKTAYSAFQNLPRLKKLHIQRSYIDASICALFHKLQSLYSLSIVCAEDDEALGEICESAKCMTSLQQLAIAVEAGIESAGARSLAVSVSAMPSLRQLDVNCESDSNTGARS